MPSQAPKATTKEIVAEIHRNLAVARANFDETREILSRIPRLASVSRSPTPETDALEREIGLAWFGQRAPLERAHDESAKFRELARSLETRLILARIPSRAQREGKK